MRGRRQSARAQRTPGSCAGRPQTQAPAPAPTPHCSRHHRRRRPRRDPAQRRAVSGPGGAAALLPAVGRAASSATPDAPRRLPQQRPPLLPRLPPMSLSPHTRTHPFLPHNSGVNVAQLGVGVYAGKDKDGMKKTQWCAPTPTPALHPSGGGTPRPARTPPHCPQSLAPGLPPLARPALPRRSNLGQTPLPPCPTPRAPPRFDVEVFSPMAEEVQRRVTRGAQVVVHGRLQKVGDAGG